MIGVPSMKLDKRNGIAYKFDLVIDLVFLEHSGSSVFEGRHIRFLHAVFDGVCQRMGCRLISLVAPEPTSSWVGLVVRIAPNVEVSRLVGALKTASSRRLRNEFEEFGRRPRVWYRGYAACSHSFQQNEIEHLVELILRELRRASKKREIGDPDSDGRF